jgi:hypothetical protein
MNIGLLWYDNDPKADLTTKVERAAVYYDKKYGGQPNLCFVHPTMVCQGVPTVPGVEIRTSRSVLPNHFWMGVDQPISQS